MRFKAVSAAIAMSVLLALSGCVTAESSSSPADASANESMPTESSSTPSTTSTSEDVALEPEETAGPVDSAEELQSTASEGRTMNVKATLNGQDFDIELADNDTARAFAGMLPLSGTLSELNGNEKYLMIGEALPSSPSNPGTIEAGDVMLYQDDCIVVFYETHSTSYSYTRIGKVTDTTGLAAAVGSGSVEATFAAR